MNQQRLVAVVPVISMKFGEFLLPVGGVVGGVHVENYPATGWLSAVVQPVITRDFNIFRTVSLSAEFSYYFTNKL